MSKIVLVSDKDWTKNRSFAIPVAGDVTFSEDNTIEVTEEQAEKLNGMNLGNFALSILETAGGEKKKSAKASKTPMADDSSTDDSSTEDTKDDLIAKINSMVTSELNTLLANYPAEETKYLKKDKEKKKFLIGKLTNSAE